MDDCKDNMPKDIKPAIKIEHYIYVFVIKIFKTVIT